MNPPLTIGILALQGDYSLHQERLQEIGCKTLLVRKPSELHLISALVLPGGESTTLLKLLNQDFRKQLKQIISSGLPTLATCAGLIILAQEVVNPKQDSLGCLGITVERNSYGRQLDSFTEILSDWTLAAREIILQLDLANPPPEQMEGVFIRAPRIIKTNCDTEVLLARRGEPVLVKQGNILGSTFHPEVSSLKESAQGLVHRMLVGLASNRR